MKKTLAAVITLCALVVFSCPCQVYAKQAAKKPAATAAAKKSQPVTPKTQVIQTIRSEGTTTAPAEPPRPQPTVKGGLVPGTAKSDVLDKVTPTESLPEEIVARAQRARVSLSDLSIVAVPLNGQGKTIFYNAREPRQPASIEKTVTAAVAFSTLGPAKIWTTVLAADEEPEDGVIKGNLYLIGGGDPFLSMERFWLLVDNLKARGVKRIEGNLVVDRSLFSVPDVNPFSFDGEGNRPYNLGPDALMINSRALFIKIRPDPEKGVAFLYPEPALENITIPKSIPLSRGGCGAWRTQIQPDYSNPYKPVFNGAYPLSCGKNDLLYTAFSQNEYIQAVFGGLWKQGGGTWKGKVVSGKAPEERVALAVSNSQPLTQMVYNMNKYSNNLMARQVFLALGKTGKGEPKTLAASRRTVRDWANSLGIPEKELYVDNGSGLSRTSRLSAYAEAKVLEAMWNSSYMPEFMASLPVSNVDGTMRKRRVAPGFAHIKTGYVSSVRSIAGYVLTKTGHRYAVVAIINGSGALGGTSVLDSVIDWVYSDC